MKSAATKSSSKSAPKSSKRDRRLAEKAAKRAARKGDGTFPDLLIVSKYKGTDQPTMFSAYDGATMDGLNDDGAPVAIYKLRRVSTMSITRKVAR